MGEDIVRIDAESGCELMPDIYRRAASTQKKTASVAGSGAGKFDPYNSSRRSEHKVQPPVRNVAGQKPAAGFDPYNSV